MKLYYFVLFVVFMANCTAYAETAGLDGDLVISREPLSDPMPDSDRVAYMTLRGSDAMEVYRNMPAASDFPNACGVEGMTARVAGNLICYETKASDYLCSFGIRLTDGGLTLGKPC